ncbi:MAG: hypothetical protein FH749_11005 [Firmicutes bacterium]|nr:hypothetical protein [Bacillota bacterium]
MMIAVCTAILERFLAPWPLAVHVYNQYYQGLVNRELRLTKISSADRVLCIGGGPVPGTALEIVAQTGANVDVLDCDPTAVRLARRVVSRHKCKGKVQIFRANGCDFDLSQYTLVHIARQAQPQSEILNHAWRNLPRGARIILRPPRRDLHDLYTCLTNRCWHINCILRNHNCLATHSSILLSKPLDADA